MNYKKLRYFSIILLTLMLVPLEPMGLQQTSAHSDATLTEQFHAANEKAICNLAELIGVRDETEGMLSSLSEDDFIHHKTRQYNIIIHPITRQFTKMYWNQNPSIQLGSRVRATGIRIGDIFCLNSGSDAVQLLEAPPLEPSITATAVLRKTLVMIVSHTPNTQLSPSDRQIIQSAIDDPNPTVHSVNNIYMESSYGKLGFTGDIVGPFIAPYTSGCTLGDDLTYAMNAATAAGVNLSQYSHLIVTYVDPTTISDVLNACGIGGRAYLNSNISWNLYYNSVDVYAHELGHNLGMQHASLETSPNFDCYEGGGNCDEYGDLTDPMGAAWNGGSQFNALHRIQMGWLPQTSPQIVTQSGSYRLYPLENDATVTGLGPTIIQLNRPDGKGSYSLSYRIAQGLDQVLPVGLEQLNIHRWIGFANRSVLESTLSDGQLFNDINNNISVNHIRHLSDGSLGFDISLAPLCQRAAPTVSITPPSQTVYAGSSATYTISITNQDSVGCPISHLLHTNKNIPNELTAYWDVSSSDLASGQTNTAHLTLMTTGTITVGNYAVPIQISESSVPEHLSTGAAQIQVVATLFPSIPHVQGIYDQALQRIRLIWTPSSSSIGLSNYGIFKNGRKIAAIPPTQNSFAQPAPRDGNIHYYLVKAKDTAGRETPSETLQYRYPFGFLP